DVARRQCSELALQPAGAPTVISDGNDGCDVPGVLLQTAEQVRESRAAANHDDLGASTQVPVVIDDVHDALVALGLDERREQRRVELPDGEEDQAQAGADEEGAARPSGKELQGGVVDEAREGVLDVDLAQEVSETQAHNGDASQQQKQPALDVHAEVEPLDEAGVPDQRSHPALQSPTA